MFSANITNRDPAEILLKNTADREFPQDFFPCSEPAQGHVGINVRVFIAKRRLKPALTDKTPRTNGIGKYFNLKHDFDQSYSAPERFNSGKLYAGLPTSMINIRTT